MKKRVTYNCGGEVPIIAIESAAGTAGISAMIKRGGVYKDGPVPNSHLICSFSPTNIGK